MADVEDRGGRDIIKDVEKASKHEPNPHRPLNERIVSAPAALLGSLRVGTFSVSEQGERDTTLCW